MCTKQTINKDILVNGVKTYVSFFSLLFIVAVDGSEQ